jgi:hypothetical protein
LIFRLNNLGYLKGNQHEKINGVYFGLMLLSHSMALYIYFKGLGGVIGQEYAKVQGQIVFGGEMAQQKLMHYNMLKKVWNKTTR